MPFQISSNLIAELESWRDRETEVESAVGEDAFLLDPGLGPSWYLTREGRVLRDGRLWDATGIREATDDEATAALVVGDKKTGIRSLLELVPSPPAGARTCARCSGSRYLALGAAGWDQGIVCVECSGRGWAV